MKSSCSKIRISRYLEGSDLFKSSPSESFVNDLFEVNLVLKCDPAWEDSHLNPYPFDSANSDSEWNEKINSIGKIVSLNPFVWIPLNRDSIKKISNSLSLDSSTYFFEITIEEKKRMLTQNDLNLESLIENTLICLTPLQDYVGFELYMFESEHEKKLNEFRSPLLSYCHVETNVNRKHLEDEIKYQLSFF